VNGGLLAVLTIARWAEVHAWYRTVKSVMTRIMYCTLSCTKRREQVDGYDIGVSKSSRILCVKVFNEVRSAGLRTLFFFFPSLSRFLFRSFACMFCAAILCNAPVADSTCLWFFGVGWGVYQRRDSRIRPFDSPHLSMFSFLCPSACNYSTRTDECRYQEQSPCSKFC
jgi:hypothetical protein